MGSAPRPPEWYELALMSAGVSAVISLLGGWLLAWWTGTRHKLRKYEEELIRMRVEKCNGLLQHLLDLCEHISPVAKGTNALEKRGAYSRPDDGSNQEAQRTAQLRAELNFVQRNALYLGRDICLTAVYFDCGFDHLTFRIGTKEGACKDYFPALCNWTWEFEDRLKTEIANSLKDATFTPPTALELQAARTKGYDGIKQLIERIEAEPGAYSIEARNAKMKALAQKLQVGI